MSAFRIVFAVLAAAGIAACASQQTRPVSRSALACDEAVAQATAFGRGSARVVAINSLKHQTADVRGYLVSQGYRHIRPVERSLSCRQHPFGSGLVQCTAIQRFCGR